MCSCGERYTLYSMSTRFWRTKRFICCRRWGSENAPKPPQEVKSGLPVLSPLCTGAARSLNALSTRPRWGVGLCTRHTARALRLAGVALSQSRCSQSSAPTATLITVSGACSQLRPSALEGKAGGRRQHGGSRENQICAHMHLQQGVRHLCG